MNCLFCDIINKKIPSEIIAETKFAFAFNDINPKSLIHMLIVPKIHLDSALDLNDSNIHYFSEMILLANKLANKYSFDDKGFRWVNILKSVTSKPKSVADFVVRTFNSEIMLNQN